MSKIELDHLQEKTDLGLQVKPFLPAETFEEKARALGFHRDDHYIFLLFAAGSGMLIVDMQEVRLEAGQLFYVLPGQVHQHVRTRGVEGWFVAVDRALVPAGCRSIFEGGPALQPPCTLTPLVMDECSRLLTMLARRLAGGSEATRLYLPVAHALLQTFLWLAANTYAGLVLAEPGSSRPAELCRQFRVLLSELLKSPRDYAARLHVSTSYLNEAVRGETGLSCSHWIRQEIVMEAKRLLCHTDLTVKEVAHELGYADPAYFSRFFRRAAGMPAQVFRERYRR